jgi:glutathione S-transferase
MRPRSPRGRPGRPGADANRRFSPFCWRIRLALEHKDLPFEGRPWRFTAALERQVLVLQREADAPAERAEAAVRVGAGEFVQVPVLVDGERIVADSGRIAAYLEETYPDRPSLFGGSRDLPNRASRLWRK